jgi:membrane-bound serine protease (ClpP class)
MILPGQHVRHSWFTAASVAGLGLLAAFFTPNAHSALQPGPSVAATAMTPANTTVYVVPLSGPLTPKTAADLNAALAAMPAGAPVLLDLDLRGGDPTAAVLAFQSLAGYRANGPVAAYVRAAVGPGVLLLAAIDRLYAPTDAAFGPGTVTTAGTALPLPADQLDSVAAPAPFRTELVRAFFEPDFSLIVGDVAVKKPGTALSMTGTEAARMVGQPPVPLLVNALAPTLAQALSSAFGPQVSQTQTWSVNGFTLGSVAETAPNASPAAPASTPSTPVAISSSTSATAPVVAKTSATPALNKIVSVYVVPIQGEIDTPQLYILRRALKSAIENHVDAVVLDMDTPGGSVAVTLDMMDALAKFPGRTFTYVNPNAVSGGSYIAVATNDIYFAPDGVMGAAAVVGGEGEDISETMKMKITSYLIARVQAISGPSRYRADVQRAMMDANFTFTIGDRVIKPAGELLSLTAKEACATYGTPPEPLLGAGIAPNVTTLLTQVYGPGGYTIKEFNINWAEHAAKWLNSISAILLGAGLLLLALEFKLSSFGVIGFAGVGLLLLVFASNYIAGLAGYEPLVLFVIGMILIGLELFVFTGSLACGFVGALFFFGSFVWAMTDVWPSEPSFGLTPDSFARPLLNVVFGVALALAGFGIALRLLPKTPFYSKLVNQSSVPLPSFAAASGAATATTGSENLPAPGTRGTAITDLRPLGEIDIAGGRYQARATQGQIDRGAAVEVVSRKDFALQVKKAESA